MRRRIAGLAAALALVALAACGSGSEPSITAAAGTQGNVVTAVKSYRFEPGELTVSTGAAVMWSNDDNFVHNVHLLDGSDVTKPLPIGGSASITFTKPGVVRYECSLHPAQMKGSVTVR